MSSQDIGPVNPPDLPSNDVRDAGTRSGIAVALTVLFLIVVLGSGGEAYATGWFKGWFGTVFPALTGLIGGAVGGYYFGKQSRLSALA